MCCRGWIVIIIPQHTINIIYSSTILFLSYCTGTSKCFSYIYLSISIFYNFPSTTFWRHLITIMYYFITSITVVVPCQEGYQYPNLEPSLSKGPRWWATGRAFAHGVQLDSVQKRDTSQSSSGPTTHRRSPRGTVQCGLGGRQKWRPLAVRSSADERGSWNM